MKTIFFNFLIIPVLMMSLINCSRSEKIIVEKLVTGPVDANCYLVYGEHTKEAALIDVGGPIDSLISIIEAEDLELKYLLCTHGHFDHVCGLEKLVNKYPDSKYCLHEIDYEDMLVQLEWILNKYDENVQAMWRKHPHADLLFNFSPEKYGIPDIFLEDDMILKLGYNEIMTVHTPGHSAGGMCFSINNALFTGDVLFYRSVGNTDSQNSNREDQVKSVKKLYDLFPDETVVYPGHGRYTDIGSEKKENPRVAVGGGDWVF